MTPVLVTWADSHDVGDGWLDPDALDSGACIVTTVGYLAGGAKAGHVTVVQSIADDGTVRHAFAIPVGMVLDMVALDGSGARLTAGADS